jgi:DNA modification methylase
MEKNLLFYGDNLEVMRKYIKDDSIDLCYIDPPFNSKRNYNQIYNNIGKEDTAQAQAFVDTWTWNDMANESLDEIVNNKHYTYTKQSIELIIGFEKVLGKGSLLAYLVSMTQRIAEIFRVLKPTGSFYLHCDPTASHYLKLVCDALFCNRGGEYVNEITWLRGAPKNNAKQGSKHFGRSSDIIFFYTKTKNYLFNHQFKSYTEEEIEKKFKYKDERGLFTLHPLDAPGGAAKGNPQYEFLGVTRYWRYSKENMQKLLAEGKIYQAKAGNVPMKKFYLDESEGVEIQSIWTDIVNLRSQNNEFLGYPTQKPEALLERIIQTSSNEGDVVLDAYCGCGTTIAVAERLKRNWIGIDITYQSISLILKRLEDSFHSDFTKDVVDKNTKQIIRPAKLILSGVPQDFESAVALANKQDDRIRKEFEKWAVLTFSNNRAIINDKKGGDGGIDGTAYMVDADEKGKSVYKTIIFSVKSNKTLTPTVIRDLFGTMTREKAEIGYLITLYPMPNLVKEAAKYGTYQNTLFGHTYPKIEVISIEEMLEGKKMQIPTSIEVLKSAEQKNIEGEQKKMF